jgi:hypothetical protein
METSLENNPLMDDVWQKIPPEEKVLLISQAHGAGISTLFVFLAFTGAIAVGLKMPWMFWGSFFLVPFVFQVASVRSWNVIKPRAIVQFTAARATTSIFAKHARGQDLNPTLIFKGALSRETSEESSENSLLHQDDYRGSVPVWITLFPDSLVMFSEQNGGARREFAHSIFDFASVSSEGLDDPSVTEKRILLEIQTRGGNQIRWNLTSAQLASLVVCERKLQGALERRDFILQQTAQAKRGSLPNSPRASIGM